VTRKSRLRESPARELPTRDPAGRARELPTRDPAERAAARPA
jgi:hypothetical protein